MTTRGLASLIFAALLLLLAAPAEAHTYPPEAVALGAQTERAELVAVGTLRVVSAEGMRYSAEFSVEETIRGDLPVGATVEVHYPRDGATPPWREGQSHLLFLVREPKEGAWLPLVGPSSIRPVPVMGPSRRHVLMVRRIAASLSSPELLLALFVDWMEEEDSGVAWTAAVDFSRRVDLHAHLTGAMRQRILIAYQTHRFGKASKEMLALALGAARPEGAAEALVSTLLHPQGRTLRGTVVTALGRLADPEAPALLVGMIEGATGPRRADLVHVLGRVGAAESLTLLRRLVTDPHLEARVEAGHALGLVARTMRARKPGLVVAGREELSGLLAAAKTENEIETALWALAQLDDPDAFATLRRLALEDPRPFVKRHAERYLTRPRLSLILN